MFFYWTITTEFYQFFFGIFKNIKNKNLVQLQTKSKRKLRNLTKFNQSW